MENKENILEVENLQVSFHTYAGEVKAVRGVSFSLSRGETLAFVGESGCGKSVTAKSIMRLLKPPVAEIKPESKIICDEKDVMKMSGKEIYALRGDEISMIFQDPMTSLNPTMKVGKQIMESLMLHRNMKKAEARKEAIRMLKMVNIPSAEKRVDNYPHEMSGGMRQRVMIAMALACNPKILIADEPTTALDVTIQAQILDLLKDLKDKINSSIMLITHDLGVVANMADYVVVMYAGRVIEKGTAREIFNHPAHPYTIGLMKSKPVVGKQVEELYNIPGNVPNPVNMPNYCYFRDRCEYCTKQCDGQYPPEIRINENHIVSCYRFFEDGKILGYPKSVNVEELL